MQRCWLGLILIGVAVCGASYAAEPVEPLPRALAFLAREVPRWARENKCYSCHNNGDAARALYAASRLGFAVDAKALGDTTEWLAQPQKWKDNGGEEAFSDKKLAAIQFGSALLAAVDTGRVRDKSPLQTAAQRVAEHQEQNGSWQIGAAGSLGSPATYGPILATGTARDILQAANPMRFREEIKQADLWLHTQKPKTVFGAAATLLAIAASQHERAPALRKHCLEVIEQGEHRSGGWGPYVTSRPEPFDSALVLLALAKTDADAHRNSIEAGRRYLIDAQLDDGSWVETTRPAGAESYAQRISTTGWATLALLRTEPQRK